MSKVLKRLVEINSAELKKHFENLNGIRKKLGNKLNENLSDDELMKIRDDMRAVNLMQNKIRFKKLGDNYE